ncbi:alpha/beta fold hydrolase [Gammaproteobacteria bacterium]|nr:alpha/beta fold hydrolase [Gammaproteobacteria bacterium]MDA8798730.1 alpha/beta fold hydrolase [Gammaproteobacteria bacterium]MDC0918349.1 alpha/beta fold hydrolase [Gammaproteobacteria bacterium]
MKKYFFTFCFLGVISALSSQESRTENNGNLILEDIPAIPNSIKEDLSKFQNVRSAAFRGFNNQNEGLFISTRFGNVSQLHLVKSPGAARNQITYFQEPIGSVAMHPTQSSIAFTMDRGGSEYSQIYLLDPKSASTQMLTDGVSRNGGPLWSNSGDRIAFQSTKRNGSSNDVWVMSIDDPQNTKLILESPDGSWWGAVDWTEDDDKVLIQNYISIANSKAYIVDLNTQKKTLLLGNKDAPSVNSALAFDKDDKGIFFITNQYGEFNQLAYYNIATSEVTVISKEISWDVDGFSISEDSKKAAFVVNENGYSSLYLLNPKSFAFKKVTSLPIGLIGSMQFSKDNRSLGLTLNTYQSPSDTYVLDLQYSSLRYGKLTRWTYSEVGGLDTSKFVEPELIHYESFDGRKIPAFIYAKKTGSPQPVIISIHGGPEGQARPSFSSTYQLWMANLGAAVITPNVRGSDGYGKEYLSLDNGFKREDSVKDIGALLDWIKTQPHLDSSRVAVYGGSYGGYMVLASAVHYSDRLKAAVDIVGISNFVTFLKNTKDYRRDLRRVEYGDERDPDMEAFLQNISPNNNVDQIQVPMFVVQGENDPRVPVTEAEQVVKSLRNNGKKVWYMNALNEGHGYRKKENRDIYQQAVILFLKENL